jgi:glycosyltransferase involved in cell wall biosynthesis
VKKVSIIIPAKNEESNLPKVMNDLYKTIPMLTGYETQVICVDDRSSDRTAEIAKSFGAQVIRNTGKSGKGMALRAGFDEAHGDILVMMDADYSHRTERWCRPGHWITGSGWK